MTTKIPNNTGVIFKNEKDQDSQPDYIGAVNIEGQNFWLSGRIKISKSGKKYMSLSFGPEGAIDAIDDGF